MGLKESRAVEEREVSTERALERITDTEGERERGERQKSRKFGSRKIEKKVQKSDMAESLLVCTSLTLRMEVNVKQSLALYLGYQQSALGLRLKEKEERT